ncbi:hypothetical protein NL389_36715, partial [Klebsiella pneumoniae]|nr:hypothetical protein [Klebsiella pneumoniae]
ANMEPTKVNLPKFSGPIYLAPNEVTKIKPNMPMSFSDIIHKELLNMGFESLAKIFFVILIQKFDIFTI